MAASVLNLKKWNGAEIYELTRDGNERGLIAMGELVANEAVTNVHVITGTLQRSIHVATPGAGHSGDEAVAGGGDLRGAIGKVKAKRTGSRLTIEVGSWISYAAKEEALIGGARGGRHAYMKPALETTKGRLPAEFVKGFRMGTRGAFSAL